MPLPVLAGIPWLAGVIGALFASIFNWLLKFFTKRFAVVGAAVAVIATITSALFVAFEALFSAIVIVSPDWVASGAMLVVPSNANLCISTIVSAYLLKWVYSWQVRIIQYKLF